MEKILINTTACRLALFILFCLPTTCSSQGNSTMQENLPQEKTSYRVPEEKAQLWESLKNNAQKDYDVCQEHCGFEQSCLDRCETVYKYRLDREYNNLLPNEQESAPDK